MCSSYTCEPSKSLGHHLIADFAVIRSAASACCPSTQSASKQTYASVCIPIERWLLTSLVCGTLVCLLAHFQAAFLFSESTMFMCLLSWLQHYNKHHLNWMQSFVVVVSLVSTWLGIFVSRFTRVFLCRYRRLSFCGDTRLSVRERQTNKWNERKLMFTNAVSPYICSHHYNSVRFVWLTYHAFGIEKRLLSIFPLPLATAFLARLLLF